MKKIACIGDNCIDFYDETGESYPGGNPVNVSVYLQRLGLESSYIGIVGDDEYGRLMINSIKDKNVDVSHMKVLKGNTAITHVKRVDGERVFGEDDPGVVKEFFLTDEDLDFIAGHDLVVTGLWGYTEPFLAKIKERGIPIAYDASDHPTLPQCKEGIKQADYLFFSDDDSSETDLRLRMQSIARKGPKVVVAMRGKYGSLALEGDRFESLGVEKCNVVDTMGAGDSYIAGFMSSYIGGADLLECMRKGSQTAAVTIGYKGAW
jgi:fructoselysine 6-kinase